MSDLARFMDYARAFEIAQATGDGAHILPFFAADARHRVDVDGAFGADDAGARSVVDGLLGSVSRIDRRFDLRIPEILDGPLVRDDGVYMRFGLTLRREGLPDLVIEGDHLAAYDDEGRIVRIDEKLLGGCGEAGDAFLREHDGALLPAGSPIRAPRPADLPDLRDALQRSFVRAYGHAKSHQDVEAALRVCHPEFGIDMLPFGIASHGQEETAAQLGVFFSVFPDYRAEPEGIASGADGVGWWGRISQTFEGPLFGHAPTGRRAELPAFCVFTFRDGLIARERFMFDLGALCDGIGLPRAELERTLGALRAA